MRPRAIACALTVAAAAGSCGGEEAAPPERWARLVVDADPTDVFPVVAGTDVDAVEIRVEADGCEPQAAQFPLTGDFGTLPQDVVVVAGACGAAAVTVSAIGLQDGAEVARSEPAGVELIEDGAEARLLLSRVCEDGDGDGYGGAGPGCPPEPDCDPADAAVHPGAREVCDDRDTDCDGASDGPDGDADGVLACAGDCNDQDAEVHPGAAEWCDDVDQDCAGDGDEGCLHVRNPGFEEDLAHWDRLIVDTEGDLVSGASIFDAPRIVTDVPGLGGTKAVQVTTNAEGNFHGLMLCSEPTRLLAGHRYEATARVQAIYPGTPKGVWAGLRLHGADLTQANSTISVGAPVRMPPAGEWRTAELGYDAGSNVRARLCLIYRSIRADGENGPTTAGTALVWDDAGLVEP